MKKYALLAALPLVPLLAGCAGFPHSFKISSGGNTATCSVSSSSAQCSANGKSVTVAPGNGSGPTNPGTGKKDTLPVASPQGTANIPGPTVTPTVNTQAAVNMCLGGTGSSVPSQDTLVSLTTTQGVQKLSVCLALTPAETNALVALLVQDAINAMQNHQWETTTQRQTWTQTTVTSDVTRCEGGS